MREIKFRVWNKQYMEFDIFDVWNPYCLENGHFMKIEGPVGEEWTETTAAILMQYTGLQDKNDIDIYEGDIIVEKDSDFSICKNRKYQVIYKTSSFGDMYGLCLESLDKYPCNTRKFIHHVSNDCTIVGNIYENPELLKEINV